MACWSPKLDFPPFPRPAPLIDAEGLGVRTSLGRRGRGRALIVTASLRIVEAEEGSPSLPRNWEIIPGSVVRMAIRTTRAVRNHRLSIKFQKLETVVRIIARRRLRANSQSGNGLKP